ncbi:radical SAM protein [Clostridium sp.]|uniref:radical SAM protein n=1 Tax=Clostridium sp. TaxID=1506 RepID=UPI003F3BAB9B
MYNLKFSGLYVEITSFCNRDCPYCYNDSSKLGTYMEREKVDEIIRECANNNINHITLSGGEPFSHPDIMDILEQLEELNMYATIITNLSLLSEEHAIKLLSKGHKLQITLDSTKEIDNDICRGKGSYKLTMSLLDKVKEYGYSGQILLRYNVGKNNSDEIEEVIKIAVNYHVKTLNISLLVKSGRGNEYEYVYDFNDDVVSISELAIKCQAMKIKYKEKIEITFSDLEKQVGCVLFADGQLDIGPKIEPNGDIFVCQMFCGDENIVGNVYNTTISTALSSEKAKKVIDKVRSRKEKQSDCKKCSFNEVCMCGCPAASYAQTGDIFEKADQCGMIKFFMKEKIKKMGSCSCLKQGC